MTYDSAKGDLYNAVSDVFSGLNLEMDFTKTGKMNIKLPENLESAVELYDALLEIPTEIFEKDARFSQLWEWMQFIKDDVEKWKAAKK